MYGFVVAGSRRTCINWQFAQVGRYSRQHEDHSYGDDQFPLSYPTLTDPISGRSSGILQRAPATPACARRCCISIPKATSRRRAVR
jgi:hypothetical protein